MPTTTLLTLYCHTRTSRLCYTHLLVNMMVKGQSPNPTGKKVVGAKTNFFINRLISRPYYSTKKRPSSSQVTFRPHVVSTSLNLRTNVSAKIPTQPPRHSSRPMSTDSLVVANSIHVGWQASTEPGFITSMKGEDKQSGGHWQITTEPGFVTRFKVKPSSSKPKPTKKPLQGGGTKNSTKHGNKVSRPTVAPVTTTTTR